MPAGLIVFGDKSHTDPHGALSLTLIIFTLTLFNRAAHKRFEIVETNWLHSESSIWKRNIQ
jgi:hypothetical protein